MYLFNRSFPLRWNDHGGGLGGVQSHGDGRVERRSGRLPDVFPAAACRGRRPQRRHEYHERSKASLTCLQVTMETDEASDFPDRTRFLYFSGFRLNSADVNGEQTTLTYHRYAEALKFANGIKNHIRDPKFSSDKVCFTWSGEVRETIRATCEKGSILIDTLQSKL